MTPLAESLCDGDICLPYFDIFLVDGVELSVVNFNHLGDLSLLFFGESFETVDFFEVVVDGLSLSHSSLQVFVLLFCLFFVVFQLLDFALVLLDEFLDGIALMVVDGGGEADVSFDFLSLLTPFKVNLSTT